MLMCLFWRGESWNSIYTHTQHVNLYEDIEVSLITDGATLKGESYFWDCG